MSQISNINRNKSLFIKELLKDHLLRYNSFNQYEYINTFTKPIITFNLGSNYSLDEKLRKEIRRNGINLRDIGSSIF